MHSEPSGRHAAMITAAPRLLLACALLCRVPPARAQHVPAAAPRPAVRAGDSTSAAPIDSALRVVYARARPSAGLLTRANPLHQPGAIDTEVQSFAEDGRLTRLVANVVTPYGRYSVEYFGEPGAPPRFVFETAWYYDDAAGRPASRHFWGQPSWERRTYLVNGRVTFTETIGDGANPASDGATHARRVDALRRLLVSADSARRLSPAH